jgi:hypothetical protein
MILLLLYNAFHIHKGKENFRICRAHHQARL